MLKRGKLLGLVATRGVAKTKNGTLIFNYNWEEATLIQWNKHWYKLLEQVKKENKPLHKWRMLNWFGLDFRHWRKQLSGDYVEFSDKKIAWINDKIQMLAIAMIDKVWDDPKAIIEFISKEAKYIYELDDEGELNASVKNIKIELKEQAIKEALNAKLIK